MQIDKICRTKSCWFKASRQFTWTHIVDMQYVSTFPKGHLSKLVIYALYTCRLIRSAEQKVVDSKPLVNLHGLTSLTCNMFPHSQKDISLSLLHWQSTHCRSTNPSNLPKPNVDTFRCLDVLNRKLTPLPSFPTVLGLKCRGLDRDGAKQIDRSVSVN